MSDIPARASPVRPNHRVGFGPAAPVRRFLFGMAVLVVAGGGGGCDQAPSGRRDESPSAREEQAEVARLRDFVELLHREIEQLHKDKERLKEEAEGLRRENAALRTGCCKGRTATSPLIRRTGGDRPQ